MAADARAIHPFSATVLRNVANARIVGNELFALESVFERALPNIEPHMKVGCRRNAGALAWKKRQNGALC